MRWQIMDSTSRFAFVVPHALDNVSAVFNELDIDHRVAHKNFFKKYGINLIRLPSSAFANFQHAIWINPI